MFCGNSPNNHSLVVLAYCIPHPSEIPSKSQDGILLINTWAHIVPHACYAKKDREERKRMQHLRLHTDVHQKKGHEMGLPISETTHPLPVNELLSQLVQLYRMPKAREIGERCWDVLQMSDKLPNHKYRVAQPVFFCQPKSVSHSYDHELGTYTASSLLISYPQDQISSATTPYHPLPLSSLLFHHSSPPSLLKHGGSGQQADSAGDTATSLPSPTRIIQNGSPLHRRFEEK